MRITAPEAHYNDDQLKEIFSLTVELFEKLADPSSRSYRKAESVLGRRDTGDQEIKSAYWRMALRYHPDKNPDDPVAADVLKEITFAYDVLYDPDNRRQYDTTGSEAAGPENKDLELDLSSLGAVNLSATNG